MSFEEQVQLRQTRRREAGRYFDFLDLLKIDELERLRARLADNLASNGDSTTLTKGILVHRYLKLREAKARKLRKIRRWQQRGLAIERAYYTAKEDNEIESLETLRANSAQVAWLYLANKWGLGKAFVSASTDEIQEIVSELE